MGGCCGCCLPAGWGLRTSDVNPGVLFDGKTVIVTGANTGIGKETAREFALRGARVVIGCRNTATGEEALEDIRASLADGPGAGKRGKSGAERVFFIKLDLGDLSSVYAFVDEFAALGLRCDVLVNNAGVMNTPKQTTADGYEYQFGINHLGHFALTTELIKRNLMAEKDGRIVNLSSAAHRLPGAHMDFDDLMFEHRGYSGWGGYSQSKLANVLFTRELRTRYGSQFTVGAVHPGVVTTEILRTSNSLERCVTVVFNSMKDPSQGAATSVWVATADRDDVMDHPSLYFADCAPSNDASPASQSDDDAKRLWEASEAILAEWERKRGGKPGKKAFVASKTKSESEEITSSS